MKRVLLIFGMLFSILTAFADENVLQTIEIEPVKDTYNILLVSDKAVDVKKTIEASNKITLTLKDIRVSKTLNTIYNNVSNVDSVMVEPSGSGVKIFFQADNASASTVTFDALIAPIAKSAKQNLKLNNPIESYAPIYKENYEEVKTSSLFDKLSSNNTLKDIKSNIDEESNSNGINKTVSFGLIGLLALAIIKLFRRREPEMKIGLSQSLTDREINLHRNAQFAQPQFVSSEKPYTTVNYGLNAYQKENRNPYETTPMQFHNPRLREYTKPMATETVSSNMASRPLKSLQTQTMTQATQPQTKKMTTPVNSAPVNQSNPNIDNLKFLESMTAIYEKSGRHDLARGLKASLNKNLK